MSRDIFKTTKVFIFDVDGTLYDQRWLRLLMTLEAVFVCALRPTRIRELKWVMRFRAMREDWAGRAFEDLERQQYRLLAKEAKVDPELIRQAVEFWMERRPLKYMSWCRYAGVLEFMEVLKKDGKNISFFSDYPAREKIRSLGIDNGFVVSAVDRQVNALKPNPKGLVLIMDQFGCRASECLLVGDRDECDGQAARSVGMPFLLIHPNKKGEQYFRSYKDLVCEYSNASK